MVLGSDGNKMTKEEWEALGVQTFGLPSDLYIPIAVADLEAIRTYVGTIQILIPGRKRPTNAVVVEVNQPNRSPRVPLWEHGEADQYYQRLHPTRQLWVHVDYAGYRRAWKRLGFGEISSEVFLDHIKNREAVRLGGYRHQFLRLCTVSRGTNTSSGLNNGAEGMEKTELRKMRQNPVHNGLQAERTFNAPVILADPVDLTKMLDIPTGLYELQGVASMLKQYYDKDD